MVKLSTKESIMMCFSMPLSVIFVWHPADISAVEPLVKHCSLLLSRDISKPFSRSMNLPIFYRTALQNGVPLKIDIISDKTIIFIFIGQEIVSDDNWVAYLENIPQGGNVHVIPIALDRTAFGLQGNIKNKNFIRAYDFSELYRKDYIFISVLHEIYRYTLNESFSEIAKGKDNALRIFLSHSKDGSTGIKIAKALKHFIDNSTMRNFFDATDIAPGYRFDAEIMRYIKESTMIAIHSDSYSSRYWCQREILCAKEFKRPIIAIDSLEEFEDRRFPFATNVPSVRVDLDNELTEEDLLRILSFALLETIRFFYSKILLEQYKHSGLIKPDCEVLSRPPEVADIEKLLVNNSGFISQRHSYVVYPEPPLYSEELSFLSNLGIEIFTPLTYDSSTLQGMNVGVSISDPSEEELINIGLSSSHLVKLSQDLARYLLTRGSTLIYGGDLRTNGFTEFIFDEANALQARLQTEHIYLNNYIVWPIYKDDTVDVKKWKAKYKHIARMVEMPPPKDIEDLIQSEESSIQLTGSQNLYVWSRCLTEMRKTMIENCHVRICAGGTHLGYKGKMPGVLEEILISINMKRPIYLLGGFGGVTASVCKLIQYGTLPLELTLEWQFQNNSGYKELMDFGTSRDANYTVDIASLKMFLKNVDLNNGLSHEDNNRLFNTPFIEEALFFVLKGLKSINGS